MAGLPESRSRFGKNMMSRPLLVISVLTILTFIFVVILSGLGWNPLGLNWNFTNTGAFGDSFGPLNSAMTAIAAVAAYLAYRSQAEELERIKIEAEADKQARVNRDFENTFFNLLQLFRDTVKEIQVEDRYNVSPKSGRDAIRQFLVEHVDRLAESGHNHRSAYKNSYLLFQDDLGHYFRIFYHILKLIEESNVVNKKRYSQILRSTLSEAEITLIALNCLHGGGKPKLSVLVEKYSMLHNISNSSYRKWGLETKFKKSAFGSRNRLPNGELSE